MIVLGASRQRPVATAVAVAGLCVEIKHPQTRKLSHCSGFKHYTLIQHKHEYEIVGDHTELWGSFAMPEQSMTRVYDRRPGSWESSACRGEQRIGRGTRRRNHSG